MPTTTASGLVYEEKVVGTGDTAQSGQDVSVHYTGWLDNGTKFDSSVDRGQPFRISAGLKDRYVFSWLQPVFFQAPTGQKIR